MTTRVELSAEQFNTFLRCLMNLKEICNDVDIRDGIIRQRTNDLTSVFEMDLTSIIQDVRLPLSNLKKKLDLLKIFSGHEIEINVESGENDSDSYFTISDLESSIKFIFPSTEFMDNKFMSSEELTNIFNLDEEDMFLDISLTKTLTERIRVITLNFNTPAIQVKFDRDKAMIVSATQAKDQFAKLKTDISTTIDFGNQYSANLSIIPFCIDHDSNLEFKMYKVPEQNITFNKFMTNIDNSVNIVIYGRSAITEDVDE